MFKFIHSRVWAFDCEWIPDPTSGRAVYNLPESMEDEEVMQEMWKQGGATEENRTPFLKTVLCRVVSISAVTRTLVNGKPSIRLLSLPREPDISRKDMEHAILDAFLNAIGQHKPQLVGYNSFSADLKILMQRSIIRGVQAGEFCERPAKPWEGVDYFARGSDYNIDLMDIVGSWGKGSPSLHEIVAACGIPGKMGIDGNQVAQLWLDNELKKIIAYNEFDAVTTYLLWLRTAFFGGHFTPDEYATEIALVKSLLKAESETTERSHLKQYLEQWEYLENLVKKRD